MCTVYGVRRDNGRSSHLLCSCNNGCRRPSFEMTDENLTRRIKFNEERDLILLKECIGLRVYDFSHGIGWKMAAVNLIRSHSFPPQLRARAVRERVTHLLDQFSLNNHSLSTKNASFSVTQEMTEKEVMMEELLSLREASKKKEVITKALQAAKNENQTDSAFASVVTSETDLETASTASSTPSRPISPSLDMTVTSIIESTTSLSEEAIPPNSSKAVKRHAETDLNILRILEMREKNKAQEREEELKIRREEMERSLRIREEELRLKWEEIQLRREECRRQGNENEALLAILSQMITQHNPK